MQEAFTTEEAAQYLGLSPRTVQTYRLEGRFPRPTMVGRTPTWTVDQLDEWVAERPGRGRTRKAAGIMLPFGFAGPEFGDALAVYGLVARLHRSHEVEVEAPASGQVRLYVRTRVSTSRRGAPVDDPRVLARILAEADAWPVFSPWNQASGLSAATSNTLARSVVEALRGTTSQWLETVREGLAAVDALVEHCENTGAIADGRVVHKVEVVRACRTMLSGGVAAWPRACVDISDAGTLTVNPLAVSGGNQGRTEWAGVYGESLLALDKGDAVSAWESVLTGQTYPMLRRSPGSVLHAVGADARLVNPAWMVAVVEGMLHCRSQSHAAAWDRWPHIYNRSSSEVPYPGDDSKMALLPVPPDGVKVGAVDLLSHWGSPAQQWGGDGWRVSQWGLGFGVDTVRCYGLAGPQHRQPHPWAGPSTVEQHTVANRLVQEVGFYPPPGPRSADEFNDCTFGEMELFIARCEDYLGIDTPTPPWEERRPAGGHV